MSQGASTFLLDRIVADMRAVPLAEIQPPETPVEDGETVLGELDENLRRLWAVRESSARSGRRVALSLNGRMIELIEAKPGPEMKEQVEAMTCELEATTRYAKAVSDLFWTAIYLAFPGHQPYSAVAVRQGWKVVGYDNPHQSLMIGPLPFPI